MYDETKTTNRKHPWVEIMNFGLLLSGNYFINIKAYDEFENFTSKYISIYLNEIPKILESLIYVTNNSSQTFIYQLDSLGNFQLVKQLPGNHILSMGNSRSQHLFVGTDQNGDFLDVNNLNNLWNVPVASSNYPLFIDVSNSDNGDQSHLVLGDGRIVSYNKNGNITNSIYSNPHDEVQEKVFDLMFNLDATSFTYLTHFKNIQFVFSLGQP